MFKHALLFLGCFLSASTAFACSTCMVGDPTQSLMGAEKPYENRLRISFDILNRTEELGRAGFNKKTIDETRGAFSVAYAPNTRLMISASVPYVNRQLESFNLAEQEVTALGDAALTFKVFLQEKEFLQKRMYGLLAGVKFPTASEKKDANGVPLDFDVQVGQGATVLNFGGWYANFNFPYMFYASASYHVAGEGFQDFQAGDAVVFNTTAQYANDKDLAFSLGLEGRWSEKDTFDDIEDGDSGGTIIFLAPGVVYTLMEDMLLNAAIKIPVIDDLDGDHEESTIYTIGVTYDFEMH